MDRNANVENDTIKKWKSITAVVCPTDGKEYNKCQLVKNMFTPAGLSISSGALSFDRNAQVKGQGWYSQNIE